MTRKDYVAIAQGLFLARPPQSDETAYGAWWVSVSSLASVMADDNPRFDRDRFVTACERGF